MNNTTHNYSMRARKHPSPYGPDIPKENEYWKTIQVDPTIDEEINLADYISQSIDRYGYAEVNCDNVNIFREYQHEGVILDCWCYEYRITYIQGQYVARCKEHGRYIKTVPPAHLGFEKRKLATTNFKPSERYDIFNRDNHRCQLCGKSSITDGVILHIGHILSKKQYEDLKGMYVGLDIHDFVDHPSNLMTLCEECNSGQSKQSLPPLQMLLLYLSQQVKKNMSALK